MPRKKTVHEKVESDDLGRIIDLMAKRRIELNMSQIGISHALNLDKASWGHTERGLRHMRAIEMLQACKILGLEVILKYKE